MYDKSILVTPDVVTCCEKPVMAMKMPDDRIAATLHSLCDAVQLDFIGQLQRIQRQPALAKWLHRVGVLTLAGRQEVDVLIVTAIPAWLIGIQLSRLAPEKQALILRFQDEATDTLYRHFFKGDARPDAQPTAKQTPEPDAAPKDWVEAEAVSTLQDDIWERQYQVMAGFEREWQAVKADITSINADIVGMKVDLAALKAAQEQKPAGAAGPPPQPARVLSTDHFIQLTVLAKALRSQTGEPIKAIYADLSKAFGVEDVNDIPDADWQMVLSWLWQRGQE